MRGNLREGCAEMRTLINGDYPLGIQPFEFRIDRPAISKNPPDPRCSHTVEFPHLHG